MLEVADDLDVEVGPSNIEGVRLASSIEFNSKSSSKFESGTFSTSFASARSGFILSISYVSTDA